MSPRIFSSLKAIHYRQTTDRFLSELKDVEAAYPGVHVLSVVAGGEGGTPAEVIAANFSLDAATGVEAKIWPGLFVPYTAVLTDTCHRRVYSLRHVQNGQWTAAEFAEAVDSGTMRQMVERRALV